MKYLIPLLCLFMTSAFAQTTHNLSNSLNTLSNAKALGEIDCEDPYAPEWCRNLYKSVCKVKKTSNKLASLQQKVVSDIFSKVPKNADKKTNYDAVERGMKFAEDAVYSQGKVSRKDVSDLVTETKTAISRLISSNRTIPHEFKKPMIEQIEKVRFMTGTEYLEDLINWAQKHEPRRAREEHRQGALDLYASACGISGLEVNAFYEEGNLILCPGLIYSLEDYNPKSKQEVLTALSFTIGHELTHSIDYGNIPPIYSNLKACYEDVMKDKTIFHDERGNEVTADFWGSLVFAQKLKDQNVKGTDAVRAVALATDGFCSPVDPKQAPTAHPEGEFRVNMTLARTHELRKILGCDDLTKAFPGCTLEGALPKR